MKRKTTYIDAGMQDKFRPKDRAQKTNWIQDMVIKMLQTLQHVSPSLVAHVIWYLFTKPGKSRTSETQQQFLAKAQSSTTVYKGKKIVSHGWGNTGPKILLVHGWRSKSIDFRRMIEALVGAGYTVEGVDMKAHGSSEGDRSALPEFRDILLQHYDKNGPYHAVIGYSLGGVASGIALSERPHQLPRKLFLISSPPYVRYFFRDVVLRDFGCKEVVYERLAELVQKYYGESIDYFDLRKKKLLLETELHLIYDEDDAVVPIVRGQELQEHFPTAHWVQSRGLGHYKIISFSEIVQYIQNNLSIEQPEMVGELTNT